MPNEGKTNKEIIEELHKKAGIKSVDIRPIKKEIEEGIYPHTPSNPEQRDDKAEINALVAIFIEDIWQKSLEEIKKDSSKLFTFSPTPLIIISPPRERANDLAVMTGKFIIFQTDNYFLERESALRSGSTDHKTQIYKRFKQLIAPNLGSLRNPDKFVARGIGTAAHVMWGMVEILPMVYEKQFGKPMPILQFEKLARNCLPLIYNQARAHISIFTNMQDLYFKNYFEMNRYIVDPGSFYFREIGDNLVLELKESELSSIGNIVIPKKEQNPRTGCPAIFAMGPNHRNIIAEMYDWTIDLAKKYYIPALKLDRTKKGHPGS